MYLAAAPTAPVYVTASGARSPQEEADNAFLNPPPLPDGNADTIWLCLGSGAAGECASPDKFQRHKVVNGIPVDENGRAIVLSFDATHWAKTGPNKGIAYVYMYAADDPRSEGDRVVVVQHSVISADPTFDGSLVRNVEVTIQSVTPRRA